MIILSDCVKNKFRFYQLNNKLKINEYIKLRYNNLFITEKGIKKLNKNGDVTISIKTPRDFYSKWKSKMKFIEDIKNIFYFDNAVLNNIMNITPLIPHEYISLHLRLGDKFLETDADYILCKDDVRNYSFETITTFIEKNSDKNIIFMCDNNKFKTNIKEKYPNIIISQSQIGHTSLSITSDRQILDSITDFYILTNSKQIYSASFSGFSLLASKFNNIELINLNNIPQ